MRSTPTCVATVHDDDASFTCYCDHTTMSSSSSSSFVTLTLQQHPPPDPLEPGWILRSSRSQPGHVYYYNQETGESSWEAPVFVVADVKQEETTAAAVKQEEQEETLVVKQETPTTMKQEEISETLQDFKTESSFSPKKRPAAAVESTSSNNNNKRSKPSSSTPKQVRVLHILKKHKDSRRPSSWRQANIVITKEQARQELQELLAILQQESGREELRATMEELARTESDCSSAKRGGDLGFFGKKKMQPAFEQASFALDIGELTSDLVETSSGLHIILRIG